MGRPLKKDAQNHDVIGKPIKSQTFVVTAVSNPSGGGAIYQIDGVNRPVLNLVRMGVYVFDQSAASNNNHPIAFRLANDSSFTAGVVSTGTPGQASAQTVFTVPANAPASLKYYCTVHGNGMGNTITVDDDKDLGITVEFHDGTSLHTDGILIKQRGAKTFVVARVGTPTVRFTRVLVNGNPVAGEMRMRGSTVGTLDTGLVSIAKITKRVATDFAGVRYKWFVENDSSADYIVLQAL